MSLMILAQPDAEGVSTTWDQVRDQLAVMFPRVEQLTDHAKCEVRVFTAFLWAQWQ